MAPPFNFYIVLPALFCLCFGCHFHFHQIHHCHICRRHLLRPSQYSSYTPLLPACAGKIIKRYLGNKCFKKPCCIPVEIATYFLLSPSLPYVLRVFNLLSRQFVAEVALLVLLVGCAFCWGEGKKGVRGGRDGDFTIKGGFLPNRTCNMSNRFSG